MKKLGLFLVAQPHNGGVFQYDQIALDAFLSFPKDQYKIVVAYQGEHWKDYLKAYDIESFEFETPILGKSLFKLWKILGLNFDLWRKSLYRFHSTAQKIIDCNCDLWFFSSGNQEVYQIPVPSIATIHDLMHRYGKSFPEVSDDVYKLREILYGNIARYSLGVIADSEIGKQHIVESYKVNPDKVFVLPYVAPKYLESLEPLEDFDEKYKLPKKFLFYPAQFWEHKNHANLIRAVAKLSKEGIADIHLALAGSPKGAFENISKLIDELQIKDKVQILGYVPDKYMPEFYRRARALVMATFFGPTNIPPLEAFVLGCPVAASRVYGVPDQLKDAALYFDPNSVDEMAKVIKKIWTDDAVCQELRKKAKLHLQNYNKVHFYKKLQEIIESVL